MRSRELISDNEDVMDFILDQYMDTIKTADDVATGNIDPEFASSALWWGRLKLKAIDMMKEDMWLKRRSWVNINIGHVTSIPGDKLSI